MTNTDQTPLPTAKESADERACVHAYKYNFLDEHFYHFLSDFPLPQNKLGLLNMVAIGGGEDGTDCHLLVG
jgi:hypothetical protein